jgi:hypothetical protein
MTSRADVYAAINSERDYQEMRVKRDQGNPFHSLEEFILFMDFYLTETKRVASTTWGPEAKPATLEFVRKVVALGVAAMEHHGAPQRKGFERPRAYIMYEGTSDDLSPLGKDRLGNDFGTGSITDLPRERGAYRQQAAVEGSRIATPEERAQIAGKVDRYAFTDDGFTGDKPSDT